jgi:class 3 adenylate cyclase
MDFTAIGTTANLAARVQSEAEPDLPCISRTTHDQLRASFLFTADSPRQVTLKGLGTQAVWDVIGRQAYQ